MGTSIGDSLANAMAGAFSDAVQLYSPQVSGNFVAPLVAKGAARQAAIRRKFNLSTTDGGTAGTAVTETPVAFVDALQAGAGLQNGLKVVAVYLMFPVAVTASGTNLATITVSKRTSGGAAVTVAQNSTNTSDTVLGSNASAFVAYSMTISATAANSILATGTDVLTVSIAKSGTGVALSSATAPAYLEVVYEEL